MNKKKNSTCSNAPMVLCLYFFILILSKFR
uniref:Uncharacterized protein n=1 Tax=virus sp. ctkyY8 TaxID=2827995 RepID=A0A8S5REL0_9VIRU|nr:MAG TPA: hypothetical protein [virus sp. ctkyY8]